MSMNHRELLRWCVDALNGYDPESRAIEEHVNSYIKQQQIEDENDQTLVLEVFSGSVRYASVLKVVVDGFFNRDGRRLLRSEENLYGVIAYLALFRLEELGMAHFRSFVRAQDTNKMYRFLNFLLNDKHLRTWMKDEWTMLYDTAFVQTTLLSPIFRWLPDLKELIQQLKDKIDNKVKPKRSSNPGTVPEPFKLTQTSSRSVPIPQPIPKLQKHQPVPRTNYVQPQEQNQLSRIRDVNRRNAEERLMLSSKLQFACANPEKSEKTRRKMEDILLEQERELEFEKHKSNPVPHSILSDNVPIKLNAAAILREGRLYQRREQNQLKRLEELEAGARDATEFHEWQSRMKQQDLQQQLAEIERRRLEGKLSHEDAILARDNLIQENRLKVEQMKQKARQLMQEYMERKLAEEQQMRKLVEDVLDTHENAKEAKKKLHEYKAKIVQELQQESRELMKQALEEAEEEMRQKMELIRQIRAMEAVPVLRHKLVDVTQTSGHGLLSEMSIAELRERLALLKTTEREKEDIKRDDILAGKQAKDALLLDTLGTISRHRTEQSKAAAIRLEERKKARHARPEPKDDKLQELQQRLEEKRAERRQMQERAKIVPDKASTHRLKQLNASKKLLEESRWQELEQRKQRTAKMASTGYRDSQSASRIVNPSLLAT